MNKIPEWGKRNPEKWGRLEFNKNYLKKIEETFGPLHCEYCGKENLVIYEWYEKFNRSDMATVDHFYPSSKYEELRMNEDNFIVSCDSCNSKKRDVLWEVESIKYPISNKILKLKELNYVRT